MSKFFYDNNLEKNSKSEHSGGKGKRLAKLGTAERPLSLTLTSNERKAEIEVILTENSLYAEIEVNPDVAENTLELDGVLNKPTTVVVEKTPNRNDPCSCGSGKKYKKCCGA